MSRPANIFLLTDFELEKCIQLLRQSTDEQHRTLFSMSGYQGSKPILSQIEGHSFQLQKRRSYRNDFAPNFYGTVTPWGNGARIEGHFGPPRWSEIFGKIWLGFVVLVTIPVVVSSLPDMQRNHGEAYVGLLVSLILILSGLLAPRFGDWLGRNEKIFILNFLESTLMARVEAGPPPAIG